jgi:FkbM family methyltransferase
MLTKTLTPSASRSSVRSRFQTGVAFNLIGTVFNQGSTFVVNIVVANLLGRQIFGEYAIVQNTLVAVSVFVQLGIGYVATKYVAEFRSTDRERAGRILGMLCGLSITLAGIASFTLLFLARWLAASVLKAPTLGPTLAIGSAVLLFAVLNGFLIGTLAGLEGYRVLAKALAFGGTAYLIVCSGFAWRGGLNGAIGGQAISGCVLFVMLAFALRRECLRQGIRINYRRAANEWPIIVKFAVPGALSGFTSAPALWFASALLVRQPDGFSQMAIFSASFSLMAAVLLLPSIANNVGMSLINHHKGTGNSLEYRQIFWVNLAVTTAIVVAGAVAAAVLGPELLRLFGKNFKNGYTTLLILLVAAVPQGLAVALYQIIQSQAKMWLSFLAVSVPRDALIVILAYWLIPTHGASGVAFGYAAAWSMALLIIGGLVYRIGLEPTGRALKPGSRNRTEATIQFSQKARSGSGQESQLLVAALRAVKVSVAKLAVFRPLRERLWKAFLFLVRKKTIIAQIDGMTFHLDLGEVIDASLLMGTFEPDVTRIIESFCQPGWTILDVGANIGAHTLRFGKVAGSSGKVYAFEPTEYAYRKLLRNIALDQLDSTEAFQVAVSNRNQTQQALNYRSSWRTDGRNVSGAGLVDVVRLDDWCAENGVQRIDCIKVDVDGDEWPVLKGAEQVLRRYRPLIIIEIGAWHFRRVEENPLSLLRQLGYRFWDAKTCSEYPDLESIRAVLPAEDDQMTYSMNVLAWNRFPEARRVPNREVAIPESSGTEVLRT